MIFEKWGAEDEREGIAAHVLRYRVKRGERRAKDSAPVSSCGFSELRTDKSVSGFSLVLPHGCILPANGTLTRSRSSWPEGYFEIVERSALKVERDRKAAQASKPRQFSPGFNGRLGTGLPVVTGVNGYVVTLLPL